MAKNKIQQRIVIIYIVIIKNYNVPKLVSNHLLGKDHPLHHRKLVGVGLMIFGVAFTKLTHCSVTAINIITDLIGYGLHGAGLTPFIEAAEKPEDKKPPAEEKKEELVE